MAKWIEETMSDDSSSSSSEEEALSLCDLPIKTTTEADNLDEEEVPLVGDDDDDSEFDFGWWGNTYTNINVNGSSSDSQMCAADELFFNGQILPLRHSVSSDTALLRSVSRSDSLDHGSVTRFIGSRSSSIGSHYSSASSSNSGSINSNYNNIIPRRNSNNPPNLPKSQVSPIHRNPNPKPEPLNVAQHRHPNGPNPRMSQQPPKSTVWDFFRTGLVRGPEIDLNKLRKPRSRHENSDVTASKKSSRRRQGFFQRVGAGGGGFLSGGSCKCSVDTVLPVKEIDVPAYSKKTTAVMMRNENNGKKEKVKEAMSRRRASEWLKELSLSHDISKQQLS